MTEAERNEEIREYVLDNYSVASTWEPENVKNWCAWAAENGFLFLCYDIPGDQGKLVGLCIARPLSIARISGEIADTDYDLDGEIIYVDLTISTAGKQPMRAMMQAILQKMGGKQIIAFKRLKTQARFNIYRLGDFARKLLGA